MHVLTMLYTLRRPTLRRRRRIYAQVATAALFTCLLYLSMGGAFVSARCFTSYSSVGASYCHKSLGPNMCLFPRAGVQSFDKYPYVMCAYSIQLAVSYFKAKMHQIRFRLGLRPRPRWGSSQRSPRPPRWI